KCNVAIETRAVVKARMHCRVRAERVSQHGLHRLYPGTSGRNPAAVVAPVSLKLGGPRRTAPSYGGRPAYLIGLSALYLGLGRQAVGAMTRRGSAKGMRLAPAQSLGAAESELAVCASGRCWRAVRIEIPSRLRRRPMPTVARRALR